MRYLIILLFLYSIMSCSDSPLDGKYAKDPEISFNKVFVVFDSTFNDTVYYSRIIHNYQNEERLLVIAGEYNRSDGKPCPASGKDLFFTVKSVHGEEEVFFLDTPEPDWSQSADNITHYFKYIYPEVTNTVLKHNGIVEIYSASDTLIMYYRSYWHNNLVTDSLFYNPKQ